MDKWPITGLLFLSAALVCVLLHLRSRPSSVVPSNALMIPTQPSSARVVRVTHQLAQLQGGAVKGGMVEEFLGYSPGPLQVGERPDWVVLRQWGYHERRLALPAEGPVPPVRLEPKVPLLVPALYFFKERPWLALALLAMVSGAGVLAVHQRRRSSLIRDLEKAQRGDFAPGTLIGGYRLADPLGTGASAVVYSLASHPELVLKILTGLKLERPEQRKRFQNEVRVLQELDHPGVARLYDWGEIGPYPYLVTERLHGETLAERLQRGPLELEQGLRLLQEVAETLDFAHRRDIVHRDIKPSNLMFDARGRARLLDFGIAWKRSDEDSAPLAAGTPAFMSPEQARGQEVDFTTDYYSLALTVYVALSGRHPFQAGTAAEMRRLQIEQPIPPLVLKNRPIPEALQSLLSELLAKEPEARKDNLWQRCEGLRC